MKVIVKGVVTCALLLLNTSIGIVPILLLGILKALIPQPTLRACCGAGVRRCARVWASVNRFILHSSLPTKWEVSGRECFRSERSTLVVCNHQSWVDIPSLLELMLDKTPFFTFFLKKQLIWLPFIGLACWALDYPFMRRHSREAIARNPALAGEDLATTRRACDAIRGRPVSVVNYLEGTRFTQAKHQEQQSPYRYLLRPKAGGAAFTLAAMSGQIQTVLDVTLYYPDGTPNFWQFISGQVQTVVIHVREVPVPAELISGDYQGDERYRQAFQFWISTLWQEKDELLLALERQWHRG